MAGCRTSIASRLLRSERGAIAPITAISLFGLVGIGGLAFDYAMLVGLDTELQNAADQAALAAASQLDRGEDQCERARQAASALVSNDSIFATDGAGAAVGIADVVCTPESRRVDVTVVARTVDYTLLPVLGLFQETVQASAAASVGSAICKVPPLMICNPGELIGDPDFTVENYVGKGLRSVGGGGSSWAPGNFGFLDAGGGNGTNDLRDILASISNALSCTAETGVSTNPGLSASFADAYNTRFDIYDNGWARNNCYGNSNCAADSNSVKDLVRSTGPGTSNSCTLGNSAWRLPSNPYLPDITTRQDANGANAMGHPRDICHAVSSNGDCPGGAIGDGSWDRDLYFQVNHGIANPLGADVTRWEVYQWERNGHMPPVRSVGGGRSAYGEAICSTGFAGPPERRRTAMAVINCSEHGVNGNSSNLPVQAWVDVFFVEPAVNRDRTKAAEIYAEIIGATTASVGGNAGQIVRRDTPFLIE